MKQTNKTIEEIIRGYNEDCRDYTQEAAMENNPTPEEIFIGELTNLIQKKQEEALRGFRETLPKELKIDEEYSKETDKRLVLYSYSGYNRAVTEIDIALEQYISQTKGKDNNETN